MDEQEIDFRVEAQGIIKDIAFTVDHIKVSDQLPSSPECVYFNIVTKETNSYCVQLCVQGFRVSYTKFCALIKDSNLQEIFYNPFIRAEIATRT